jgi:hypothetical protein
MPSASSACPDFLRSQVSRRRLLQIGGLGVLGMNLRSILRAAEQQASSGAGKIKPRAKSVIFLYQFGGPSHIDMFDFKPDAPDTIRSPHTPIPTTMDGMVISPYMPALAKVMNKCTVIRSMTHEIKNHNPAAYYALTGSAPARDDLTLRDSPDLYPAYGSVVDALSPAPSPMPTFVSYPHVIADGVQTPGQRASFLGKAHDPLFIGRDISDPAFSMPELALPENVSVDRLRDRRGLQQIIDDQTRLMEYSAEARGIDDYYARATNVLSSDRVRKAFDIASEPKGVRDKYGRTNYGQGVLLARRLAESGVKFINVYFSRGIGGTAGAGWDTHGNNGQKMYPIVENYHFPITDQTLPTLLTELDERGLLDTTLVVWMGEFGRTPKINAKAGRDHWPSCYSVLLAGGGVKRGYIHGASDKFAMYPARDPVKLDDLAATIYYLLGIDPRTEVHDTQNRPLPIAKGNPVMDIIA